MTRRVHCKKEKYDVYCGRNPFGSPANKWGNPFVIGQDGTRDEVCDKFEDYLDNSPELLSQIEELRDKVLGCFCESNQRCHTDSYIKRLNAIEMPINKPIKLAVIGSRTFTDKERLFKLLDSKIDEIKCIVSGGAAGADEVSRLWSKERGVPIIIFYPRWYDLNGNYRPGGGFERNYKIINSCDRVLALYDGKSKGTAHSISIAKSKNKPCKIILFEPVIVKKAKEPDSLPDF